MPELTLRAAASSFAVVLLAGCASLQVRTDYDTDASFAQLRTYSWITSPGPGEGDPVVNSPLLERHIEGTADSILTSMGYKRIDGGTPDFRVTARVDADRKTAVRSYGYSSGYGYGPYYPRGFGRSRFGLGRYYGYTGFGLGRYGLYGGEPYVDEYLEGTLVLDIVDGRSGHLLWRGWATKRLDASPEPKNVREYAREAVREILKEFSPAGIRSPELKPRPERVARG